MSKTSILVHGAKTGKSHLILVDDIRIVSELRENGVRFSQIQLKDPKEGLTNSLEVVESPEELHEMLEA